MNNSILAVAMVFAGLVIGSALAEATQPNNGAPVIQNFNNSQASDTADTDDVAGVNEDDDDQGADNDDQGGDGDGQGADSDNHGGNQDSQDGDGDGQ
jgi:hypothetical protein